MNSLFVASATLLCLEATASADIHGVRTVDFDYWASGAAYGAVKITDDFGNCAAVKGANRMSIDSAGQLRMFLPQGQHGTDNTGGCFKVDITGKTEYRFEYDLTFDANFPWSKGGKIPGIGGGLNYTGGDPATAGDGFSVRMMWQPNGRIVPYVYHTDMIGSYGDTFGATVATLNRGQEYKIKYYVKLNTGTSSNGVVRIYVNNDLKFEKTNLRLRTNSCAIDKLNMECFAGGGDATYNMTGNGYVYYDNVSWY